jgi:hypothetical protein
MGACWHATFHTGLRGATNTAVDETRGLGERRRINVAQVHKSTTVPTRPNGFRASVLPCFRADCYRRRRSSVYLPLAEGSRRKSSQAKVSAHRRRLRAQGLRPIQIWLPDMRAPGFKAQAHCQSVAVATSPQANEDQSFIDAVSDLHLDEGLG